MKLAFFAMLISSGAFGALNPSDIHRLLDELTTPAQNDSELLVRMRAIAELVKAPREDVAKVVTEKQLASIINYVPRAAGEQARYVLLLSHITPPSSSYYGRASKIVMTQLLLNRQANAASLSPSLAAWIENTSSKPEIQQVLMNQYAPDTGRLVAKMGELLKNDFGDTLRSTPKTLEEWKSLAVTLQAFGNLRVSLPSDLQNRLWALATLKCPVSHCESPKNKGWREVTRAVNSLAADGLLSTRTIDINLLHRIQSSPLMSWDLEDPYLPWESRGDRPSLSTSRTILKEDLLYRGFEASPQFRQEIWASVRNGNDPRHLEAMQVIRNLHKSAATTQKNSLTDLDYTQLRKSFERMENVESYWSAWTSSPIQRMSRLIVDDEVSKGDWQALTHDPGAPKGLTEGLVKGGSAHLVNSGPATIKTIFPELVGHGLDLQLLPKLNKKDPALLNIVLRWLSDMPAGLLRSVYRPQIEKLLGDHIRRGLSDFASGGSNDAAFLLRVLKFNENVPVLNESDLTQLVKSFSRLSLDSTYGETSGIDRRTFIELKADLLKTCSQMKEAGARLSGETVDLLLDRLTQTTKVKTLGSVVLSFNRRQLDESRAILQLLDAQDFATSSQKELFLKNARALAFTKETKADTQRILHGLAGPHANPKGPESKLLARSLAKYGILLEPACKGGVAAEMARIIER
jgi:hypothetical protein